MKAAHGLESVPRHTIFFSEKKTLSETLADIILVITALRTTTGRGVSALMYCKPTLF